MSSDSNCIHSNILDFGFAKTTEYFFNKVPDKATENSKVYRLGFQAFHKADFIGHKGRITEGHITVWEFRKLQDTFTL